MSDMPTHEQRARSAALANGIREGEWDNVDKIPPYDFKTHSLITGRERTLGSGGGGLFSRAAAFLKHVEGVLNGTEEVRHPELFKGFSNRDVLMASSDGPETGGIGGNLTPVKAEGPLARMQRERREAESARNPQGAAVANAINDTARELGVSGASLMEAITTANNHVVPGQKSRALEEVANTLGVSQQELIKAGRNHGFTMDDGKIIVEVREQPNQKVSSSMLNGFDRPEWAGSHQAKHDDTPQGARVASAAGRATAIEGRA